MDDQSIGAETSGITPNRQQPESSQVASLRATLSAGLEALKRKDYPAAIALLENVSQANTQEPLRLKAQMGLIKAYAAQDNLTWAIALCQPLCDHPQANISQWANQTLTYLQQRLTPESPLKQDPEPSPELSPEVKVAHPSDVTAAPPPDPPATADPTGFMPMGNDPTGFVPQSEPPVPAQRQRVVLPDPPSSSDSSSIGADPTTSPTSTNPFTLAPDAVIVEEIIAEPGVAESATSEPESEFSETLPPDASDTDSTSTRAESPPIDPQPPIAQTPESFHWRQAERASKWTPLGRLDLKKFRVVQGITAIAPLALLWIGQTTLFAVLFQICRHVTWPVYLRGSFYDAPPLWPGAILLFLLYALSPWVLTTILQRFYDARSFSLDLLARHSPEAVRSLKRFCTQQRYPLPQLQIVYTSVPFVLTYGNLRRNLHITITQGLLDQLSDEEIATVVLAAASPLTRWDFPLLSWIALTAQIPYIIYRQSAAWVDRQSIAILHGLGLLVMGLSYGLYRLLRWQGLWLSRFGSYYSDRAACEATGNPNGLTRALLKLNMGIAQDIRRQGQVSPLVESFALLGLTHARLALNLGSACLSQPLEPLLIWDQQNPYRRWLAINHPHPPLGDRLYLLNRYAQHWRLSTELDFPAPPRSPSKLVNSSQFWLQIAPFLGFPVGMLFGFGLWIVGAIAGQLQFHSLSWMWGDWSLVWGGFWLGGSIGIFMRINYFFPDFPKLTSQSTLPDTWLTDPTLLPIDSTPIRLQGRLLGNSKTTGALNQYLVLQVQQTLIHLHYTSAAGPIGNLFAGQHSPRHLAKRSVIVTGWLRRGVTPWIDVETIHLTAQDVLHAKSPIWSTLLACITACIGLYLILWGNY
jgi:Zn-dependent protease with chaperone function